MHIISFFFLCVPVSVYFAWKDLELKYSVYMTKCYHCRCAGVSEKDDCKRKGLTVGILVGVFDEAVVHDDEGSPVLPAAPSYTCTAEQREGNRTCSCHGLISLLLHQATPLHGDSVRTATPSYTFTRGQCLYCNIKLHLYKGTVLVLQHQATPLHGDSVRTATPSYTFTRGQC